MPVIIRRKDQRLAYRPDAQTKAFRNFPTELLEGIQALVREAETVGVEIPPVVTRALASIDVPQADDAVFYYQRLASNVRTKILQQHTDMGILQIHEARYALGVAALVGWDNVCDEQGNQVPYDPQLVKEGALPGSLVSDIGILVDDVAPEDYLKNWIARSNGTSRSTAPVVGDVVLNS